MRVVTLTLLLLLGLTQAGLWFGKGGVARVMELNRQLDELHQQNQAARESNGRLAAEVLDLRNGLEMVEEKARAELGMVRRDEILVQYARTAAR